VDRSGQGGEESISAKFFADILYIGWWSGIVVSALALINEVNQRQAG